MNNHLKNPALIGIICLSMLNNQALAADKDSAQENGCTRFLTSIARTIVKVSNTTKNQEDKNKENESNKDADDFCLKQKNLNIQELGALTKIQEGDYTSALLLDKPGQIEQVGTLKKLAVTLGNKKDNGSDYAISFQPVRLFGQDESDIQNWYGQNWFNRMATRSSITILQQLDEKLDRQGYALSVPIWIANKGGLSQDNSPCKDPKTSNCQQDWNASQFVLGYGVHKESDKNSKYKNDGEAVWATLVMGGDKDYGDFTLRKISSYLSNNGQLIIHARHTNHVPVENSLFSTGYELQSFDVYGVRYSHALNDENKRFLIEYTSNKIKHDNDTSTKSAQYIIGLQFKIFSDKILKLALTQDEEDSTISPQLSLKWNVDDLTPQSSGNASAINQTQTSDKPSDTASTP